jgi:hypothetical protein
MRFNVLLLPLIFSCSGCGDSTKHTAGAEKHVGVSDNSGGPILAVSKRSDKPLEWRWSKEKISLSYSIDQYLRDYELKRVRPKEYYTPIYILRKQDSTIVYSYQRASENTVFTRSNDILFIAEHSPIRSGCEVVAINLKSGKQLWRTRLQGIGPTLHSK